MVKDLCTKLEDSGQNEWATSKAIEAALIFGQMDLAVSLMKDLGSKGRPLRQHYFWPLLLMAGRQQGEEGQWMYHHQTVGCRLFVVKFYLIGCGTQCSHLGTSRRCTSSPSRSCID